jgi:predicted AAA+ superfamily ATPase
LEVKNRLADLRPEYIKTFFGSAKLVVLDEAQTIKNIGQILKIMIDTYPELQIIATGSSSFDLASQVGEPLVGRAVYFTLFPLSLAELAGSYTGPTADKIDWMMRFGAYPEIASYGEAEAKDRLSMLASGYLYKDVLQFEGIKKPEVVLKLLQLLALQIGNEVSYHELAGNLKVSSYLVEKYIEILEKAFVIFRLRALSRNPRKEIAKANKIYFVDLGLRNSLIDNHNSLDIRNDTGQLWENFCVLEKLKFNHYYKIPAHQYFWRSISKKEVDYAEEIAGRISGYEFKWGKCDAKQPREFTENYQATVKCVNRDNIQELFEVR